MNAYKHTVRSLLRTVTRVPMPGRYELVELLRPVIAGSERVVAANRSGLVFALDLNDTIQRQVYFDLYSPDEVAALCRLLAPGDVVFDVGANIGFYTIHFAHRVGPGGAVHAFEPVPDNSAAIRRNLQLNGFAERVVVNDVAASNQPGVLKLFVAESPANTGWASIVPSERRPAALDVPSITLDDYVQQHGIRHVALVKMDIEGAEPYALRGMEGLLARPDAPILFVEVNPYLLRRQGFEPATLTEHLSQHGFQLYRLRGGALRSLEPFSPEGEMFDLVASKRSLA